MKIKINHDTYNISKRICHIDKGYYIMYDVSTKKFEVHNSKQYKNTFCLKLPYKELDERTLNYVNLTRSENIDKILKEIEQQNKMKENADKQSVLLSFNNLYEEELKRR